MILLFLKLSASYSVIKNLVINLEYSSVIIIIIIIVIIIDFEFSKIIVFRCGYTHHESKRRRHILVHICTKY